MSDGVYEKKTYAWRLPNGGVDYASALQETLTMRDQFAMAAMQANLTRTGNWDEDDLAECSYRAADAMMKARRASDV